MSKNNSKKQSKNNFFLNQKKQPSNIRPNIGKQLTKSFEDTDSDSSSSQERQSSSDSNQSDGQSKRVSKQVINQSQNGHSVQIAKSVNGKFELNEKALSDILLRDDMRNKPVVVVSIAGDMRKGKSFMLNFFLRYLQSGCGTANDWIGRTQNQPLQGFSWRSGSERDTIGIVMWSDPFIIKRSDGREVAVLLMDTQGAFDSNDTLKDSAIIFALSLLTSSVFIYNIHHNLQENNLDNLCVFSDFGRLALSDRQEEKPFQKLVFLIRDWSFPAEYPYGKTGGDQKIQRVLIKQKTEKNKKVRLFIEQSFEETSGFLMPYPGQTVATNPNFNGSIADINSEFIEKLEEFVPLMLSPDNLIIKKIGASEVNGRMLCTYFGVYSKVFSGDQLPEPMTLLEATAEGNNMNAAIKCKELYENRMEELCGGDNPFLSERSLKTNHIKIRDEALDLFDKTPKMGGIEYSERYRNDLIRRIENRFSEFEKQNQSKDFFRTYRPLLYVLVACFVSFLLYYLTSAVHFTPLAHVFFILSTICLGLFVDMIVHVREGLPLRISESIVVSIVMALIALFLLNWKHLWQLFGSTVAKRKQRHQNH